MGTVLFRALETAWTFGGDGDARWQGGILFGDTQDPDETASLADPEYLDIAVPENTLCQVTITARDWDGSVGSSVECSLRSSAFVDLEVDANGQFSKEIMSGAGSGLVFRPKAGQNVICLIAGIEIALA